MNKLVTLIAIAAGVLISGMIWHLADWLDQPTLDMEPRSAGIVGPDGKEIIR